MLEMGHEGGRSRSSLNLDMESLWAWRPSMVTWDSIFLARERKFSPKTLLGQLHEASTPWGPDIQGGVAVVFLVYYYEGSERPGTGEYQEGLLHEI